MKQLKNAAKDLRFAAQDVLFLTVAKLWQSKVCDRVVEPLLVYWSRSTLLEVT